MTKTTEYPNELEKKLIDGFIKLLKENKVKFVIQGNPNRMNKFNRGTKIYVNQNFTKITFHIYNVSDLGKG